MAGNRSGGAGGEGSCIERDERGGEAGREGMGAEDNVRVREESWRG